jgi:hypothetical protein
MDFRIAETFTDIHAIRNRLFVFRDYLDLFRQQP